MKYKNSHEKNTIYISSNSSLNIDKLKFLNAKFKVR